MLTEGKLVGIPTETVYGLAGNALNMSAVTEIFHAKNRPTFDPLIVHTYSKEKATELVTEMPDYAQKLATAFWPGPLTLLLPGNEKINKLITSGSDLVGIRVPNHPLTLELLKQIKFPLAAPSANPFGYISPTSAQHVVNQLGGEVAYILDGGSCTVGLESTIVGPGKKHPAIYRKGGISQEDIEAIIGPVEVMPYSSSNPKAPGMLDRHYSPRTPILLGNIPELLKKYITKNTAVLSFTKDYRQGHPNDKILSPSADTREAAVNFFSSLRELDNLGVDIILAELVPNEALGASINDRLKRAAAN